MMIQRGDPGTGSGAEAGDAPAPPTGLIRDVIGLVHEIREQAHDHLQLAVLETRLSINSLLAMAIIAIVIAILLISVWLALVGAAVMALIAVGLSPAVALLAMGACNLAGALLGWLLIRRLSNSLGWPATLRALRSESSSKGEGPST